LELLETSPLLSLQELSLSDEDELCAFAFFAALGALAAAFSLEEDEEEDEEIPEEDDESEEDSRFLPPAFLLSTFFLLDYSF
jgi:hypothetical protein